MSPPNVQADNENDPEPIDDTPPINIPMPNVVKDTEVVEVEDESGEPIEGEPEAEVDQPEVVEEAPVALTILKVQGQDWDEARIQQVSSEHAQATQTLHNYNALILEDAELKKAYAKALKRKGVLLPPDMEALTVEAPAAPKYTMAQIQAGYDKLVAEGQPGKAQALWHEYVTKPEQDELRRENAEYKARVDRDNAARQAQAQQNALVERNKVAWSQAAKDYPSVLVADPSLALGFKIKDPQVAAKFAEVNNTLGATASLRDVLDVTLARMGRLGKQPTKPAPVSTTRIIKKPSLPKVTNRESSKTWRPDYTVTGQVS